MFDNILQIAELQWFSIPENIGDITLGFKIYKNTWGIWYYNVNVFVEVTTDRKTWHKVEQVSVNMGQWRDVSVSLNDYIGCEYVQARIRFEGSGHGISPSPNKYMLIDDLYIDFNTTGLQEHLSAERFSLSVTPNPSTGIITVTTGIEHPYTVCVYNLLGIKILQKMISSDGTLDLTSLPEGTYFISADNGTDRITKRIVKANP